MLFRLMFFAPNDITCADVFGCIGIMFSTCFYFEGLTCCLDVGVCLLIYDCNLVIIRAFSHVPLSVLCQMSKYRFSVIVSDSMLCIFNPVNFCRNKV